MRNTLFGKAFLVFAAVVVLVGGFFMRTRILRMLDFGRSTAMTAPASDTSQDHELASAPSPAGTSSPQGARLPSRTVSGQPGPQKISPSRPAAVPAYTGRDPSEVRPVPDEVKLFSQDQKNQIYASIASDGKAVTRDPHFFQGWIHLGILKKNIGDFEGARDAWEYVGVIEPFNSLSFANLGDLYWRYLHDYPQAEKNFRISIQNKPVDTATYIALADLYHYSYAGKSDRAIPTLLDGLDKNQNDESLTRRVAVIYELEGKFSDAVAWWKKVLLLHPDDQEIKTRIDQLQAKTG